MNRDELELFAHIVPQRCAARWSEMQGDAKTRFCTRCCHEVHLAEGLSVEETRAMLEARVAQLFLRRDGTVKLKECPRPLLPSAVEFVPVPRRRVERAVIVVTVIVLAALFANWFSVEFPGFFGAAI